MHRIVRYEMRDFENIKTLDDFYKIVGLFDKLMCGDLTIFDVHMCKEDCEALCDIMKKNFKHKHYKKKYSDRCVAMHWLNYSPSCKDKDVPSGELWIYKDGFGGKSENCDAE